VIVPSIVAWPERAERPRLATLSAAFLVVFVLLFWASEWLASFVPWRLHVDLPWERRLPFVPWAVWIYLSMDVLLLIAPLVLRTWRELLPLWLVLVGETVVAAVCFVLLPVTPRFAPFVAPDGVTGVAFAFADTVNLTGNLLPSLHVAYALTAGLALAHAARQQRRGWVAQGSWIIWALAIAVSTVLLRQHHVLDVAGGFALGAVGWFLLGRWAGSARVLAACDVEWLCLENQWRFARRHRRYATIGLALAAASLPRWWSNRLLRTGFCALQAIDDLLDGDRPCAGEPLDVVQALRVQIETREFAGDPLSRLVAGFVADLEAIGGQAAVNNAVRLIEVMERDRRRQLAGELMDGDTLRAHHRATFTLSLDLMLLAGRCELRARDVPELVDALGWCSTVRDLDEDLAKGLVNIPRQVVDQAKASAATSWSTLAKAPPVQAWINAEGERAREWLATTDQRLEGFADRRGAGVLRRFARSMKRYLPRKLSPVVGREVSA
jgi:membrane-associated phospholipid phosphatase